MERAKLQAKPGRGRGRGRGGGGARGGGAAAALLRVRTVWVLVCQHSERCTTNPGPLLPVKHRLLHKCWETPPPRLRVWRSVPFHGGVGGMKALSPRRRPLPAPQLPFLSFRTAFFMAPGGQAPQRASQSRSWSGSNSQLFRTREEPAHCGPTSGGGADRPGRRGDHQPPAPPRALPLGMAARGQKLDNCAGTGPPGTRERGGSGNWGEEKQNLRGVGVGVGGSSTVPGSQRAHHPFLENNRGGWKKHRGGCGRAVQWSARAVAERRSPLLLSQ